MKETAARMGSLSELKAEGTIRQEKKHKQKSSSSTKEQPGEKMKSLSIQEKRKFLNPQ